MTSARIAVSAALVLSPGIPPTAAVVRAAVAAGVPVLAEAQLGLDALAGVPVRRGHRHQRQDHGHRAARASDAAAGRRMRRGGQHRPAALAKWRAATPQPAVAGGGAVVVPAARLPRPRRRPSGSSPTSLPTISTAIRTSRPTTPTRRGSLRAPIGPSCWVSNLDDPDVAADDRRRPGASPGLLGGARCPRRCLVRPCRRPVDAGRAPAAAARGAAAPG